VHQERGTVATSRVQEREDKRKSLKKSRSTGGVGSANPQPMNSNVWVYEGRVTAAEGLKRREEITRIGR